MTASPTGDTRRAAAKDERGRSFGAIAADYAAWRPSYPAAVVAFLVGGAHGRRVLDLGAGTGQLSRPLRAAGHDVDVVVAGQAAHWFDPARASPEFRRVLRPGGVVGFTWHTREDTCDWSVALAGLLAADARDQTGDRPESNQAVVDAFAAELDAAVTAHTTTWVHGVPPEAVVGRAASSSRVALLDDAAREDYLGRIRDLLATHPDTRDREVLDVTYRTSSWRLLPG